MFNSFLILSSRGESIITQHYKHIDFPLSKAICEFKSQLLCNENSIDDNQCVRIICNYSFVFIKYSDIVICVITAKNANVFNILSFEYEIINTLELYISDTKTALTAAQVRNNIIIVLEILLEMIFDGFPQPKIFDERHKKRFNDRNALDRARQQRQILSCVTGACPWRSPGANMGFSVGGAKDINNFRDCIEHQTLPKKSSLTSNGLFYEYYFQNMNSDEKSNDSEGCDNRLFYPTYSYAKSKEDYYLSVGLNSDMKMNEFKRNKLNVLIILDISGSMKLSFPNNRNDGFNDMIEDENDNKSKIDVAKDCLIDLILHHINGDDRLGILLFNHSFSVLQPFEMFGEINKDELIQKIKKVRAFGGTQLGKAYKSAVKMFEELFTDVMSDNRAIFLTDAKQNLSYAECTELIEVSKMYSLKTLSQGRICTTFIGIGIDFDSDLIHKISNNLYGCNYFAVHSFKQFKQRMVDQFDLMVTPLIFNLKLCINSEGNNYKIVEIYGNDNDNDIKTNECELMNVKTLFPSKSNTKNEVKGGIILVKIKAMNDDVSARNFNLELNVNYENRFGQTFENKQFVTFDRHKKGNEYFDNNGIRKAVILIKYINLLKEWLLSVSNFFYVSKRFGIKFAKFLKQFQTEMEIINDKTLEKEIKILQKLIQYSQSHSRDCQLTDVDQISLQITEKVNVLLKQNKVLQAKCDGTIVMDSSMMGMPICRLGLFVGKNQDCQWKFHACIRLNRDRSHCKTAQLDMKYLSFIPPNGKFDIANYTIHETDSLKIPFHIIQSIKHKDYAITFDIAVKPKFKSNEMANDIVIKIPLSTKYGKCDNARMATKYGKCELEEIDRNAYIVWRINRLHSLQLPQLKGRIALNKFGRMSSLQRTMSKSEIYGQNNEGISLQFVMNEKISTCVKVMYLNALEPKLQLKMQKRIRYMTTTDENHNIRYKI